jgi:hypothetical protein
MRSILENCPDVSQEKLERTRRLMDAYVDDCIVTGYEPLVDTLQLPDSNDRHVLAAAIKAKASFIVTFNIRDFPPAVLDPFQVQAITPDEFVVRLIDEDYHEILKLVKRQRENMTLPSLTVEQYLEMLERQRLSKTVAFLREHRTEI